MTDIDEWKIMLRETIGHTALGFYCKVYKISLAQFQIIRPHLKRIKRHRGLMAIEPSPIYYTQVIKDIRKNHSVPLQEALLPEIQDGYKCSLCPGNIMKDNRNCQRHIKKSCPGGQIVNARYRNTICNRMVPVNEPSVPNENNRQRQIIPQNDRVPARINQPAVPKLTTEDLLIKDVISPPKYVDESNLGIKEAVAEAVMSKYTRPDENESVWAVHFAPLMGASGDDHIPTLQLALELQIKRLSDFCLEKVDPEQEKYLALFLDTAEYWFEHYAYAQIKRLPGSIRSRLVVFEIHEHAGSIRNGSFYLRAIRERLADDCKKLITFCWRLDSDYLWELKRFYKVEVDQNRSMDWMMKSCIVGRFLSAVLFQKRDNPRSPLLIGQQFCLGRAFRSSSDTSDGGLGIEMVNCQRHGTSISNVIHILRAGLLGTIHERDPLKSGEWLKEADTLVRAGGSCELVNVLSPMVADMKSMHSKKPTKTTSTIRMDRSIVIGQYIFESNRIRKLVPMVHETACEIFSEIFEGNDWKTLIDSKFTEKCNREAPKFEPKFSWITSDGKAFSADQLSLKTDEYERQAVSQYMLNRLVALVETILHGLSTGALRGSQIELITKHHVVYREADGAFYFASQSQKEGTGQQDRKEGKTAATIMHKVPKNWWAGSAGFYARW